MARVADAAAPDGTEVHAAGGEGLGEGREAARLVAELDDELLGHPRSSTARPGRRTCAAGQFYARRSQPEVRATSRISVRAAAAVLVRARRVETAKAIR